MEATTEENRETIGRMFGRIAPRYDLLNRLMTGGRDRAWRRATVAHLAPFVKDGRYLDLATGTGDLALALLQGAGSVPVQVEALDVSPAMLDLARQKFERLNLTPRVSVRAGAAENLPFPADTFDGVTVGFGVRNFADRELGLREILRVLKPGGRLVILEASPPENRVQRFVQWLHTQLFVRFLGQLFSERVAYEYLGNSITHFPTPALFVAELTRIGWSAVQKQPLCFGAVAIFRAEK